LVDLDRVRALGSDCLQLFVGDFELTATADDVFIVHRFTGARINLDVLDPISC
jgi:hypothetical protein